MGLWRNTLIYLGFAEDDLGEEMSSWDDPSKPRRVDKTGSVREISTNRPLASVHKLPSREPQPDVRVVHARSYEDVRTVGDTLRSSLPVIVNVDGVEPDVAKRVIAFTCGLVYALDASLQKLGRGVYLLTPVDVALMDASPRNKEHLGF